MLDYNPEEQHSPACWVSHLRRKYNISPDQMKAISLGLPKEICDLVLEEIGMSEEDEAKLLEMLPEAIAQQELRRAKGLPG